MTNLLLNVLSFFINRLSNPNFYKLLSNRRIYKMDIIDRALNIGFDVNSPNFKYPTKEGIYLVTYTNGESEKLTFNPVTGVWFRNKTLTGRDKNFISKNDEDVQLYSWKTI